MSNSDADVPTVGLDIGGTKVLGVLLDATGEVIDERRRLSPHAGVDALVADCDRDRRRARARSDPRRCGRGRHGQPRRPRSVLAEPADRRRCPVARRAAGSDPAPDHRRQRCERRRAGRDRATARPSTSTTRCSSRSVRASAARCSLDGQLYRGAHGFGAEIGHITVERGGPLCACGEYGHWEAIASGTALGRMARELVGQGGGAAILAAAGNDRDAVAGDHVEAAARAGDADAHALLGALRRQRRARSGRSRQRARPRADRDRRRPRRAGARCCSIRCTPPFMRHVEGAAYRPRIPIVPAQLGERAGAVGAAVLARELLA